MQIKPTSFYISLQFLWEESLFCKFQSRPPVNHLSPFCAGIASMTVPVYVAEASPPHLRGQLVTVNTLFITGGQFTASLIDGAFSYLQRDGWRSDTLLTHTEDVQYYSLEDKSKSYILDACLNAL